VNTCVQYTRFINDLGVRNISILRSSRRPLHVTEIIEQCREKYDIELYRESIVSALLKKINRMDRFVKTGPNTFGLSEYRDLYRSLKQEG